MIIENNKNRKYLLLWMATDDPDDEDKQGEDEVSNKQRMGEGGRSGEKRITFESFHSKRFQSTRLRFA